MRSRRSPSHTYCAIREAIGRTRATAGILGFSVSRHPLKGYAMLDSKEAVARFFPRCTSYDWKQAELLIAWLERCGYVIVPRDETAARLRPRETCLATTQK
jgi:hypothetical protein